MEWSGLAETAYKSGIKDLIENGFLVNTVGNRYVFFESGKENKYMSKGSKEQKGADGKRIKEQQNDVDYFSFFGSNAKSGNARHVGRQLPNHDANTIIAGNPIIAGFLFKRL